ncbi:hypothetical protein V3N99_22215 (plasmid) [Dermatophilaceae bacterium Soc4.6]
MRPNPVASRDDNPPGYAMANPIDPATACWSVCSSERPGPYRYRNNPAASFPAFPPPAGFAIFTTNVDAFDDFDPTDDDLAMTGFSGPGSTTPW